MKKKGFTLIELLVVIAIIGLLSSVVLVSLGPARKKARDAKRQSDIREINLAMEMCYDDSACNASEKYVVASAGANTVTKIDTDGTPLYLTVPTDPLDVSPYQYTWTSSCTDQKYCVYAKLEAPTAVTYFCASNAGTAQRAYAGPPTISDCCGLVP